MAVVGVEGLGCLELGLGACCSGKGLLSFLFLFFSFGVDSGISVSRRVLKVDAWWERSGRNDRRRSSWNRYNDRNELHKRGTGMMTVSVTAVYLSTGILSPCRPLLSRWFKKKK